MQPFAFRNPAAALLAPLFILAAALQGAPTINVPAGIDHVPWDALLKRHVDDRGLVDYAAWKKSAEDLRALDDYIAGFAAADTSRASGDEEIASLINAYNAFTIRWILENHPTESIRETSAAWPRKRWTIGGRRVSLNEIEHQNLRPLHGWKVHAAIVCAARSCPPLQAKAFTAANLESLTAQAFRAWLGRDDLNHYDPDNNRVVVSPIFSWFKEDFTGDADLPKVLARFGPSHLKDFFARGGFSVEHPDYHWGLNDQGRLGANYKPGAGALFKSIF